MHDIFHASSSSLLRTVLLMNNAMHTASHRMVAEARTAWKVASSQGKVMPMSWRKPNSSSALRSSSWNSGASRQATGTMYRLRPAPTYTAKWPLGTSPGGPASSLLPRPDEHLLRIFFSCAPCPSFLDP
uniref:Uncharacterized protein n=1 Tax=Arundo donax TaxID=35708 RepID=A0A0A9B275_ARUDO